MGMMVIVWMWWSGCGNDGGGLQHNGSLSEIVTD